MLTDGYHDSFYKNLADNLVYNNYALLRFVWENYTNFNILEFQITLSKTKVYDDKLTRENL